MLQSLQIIWIDITLRKNLAESFFFFVNVQLTFHKVTTLFSKPWIISCKMRTEFTILFYKKSYFNLIDLFISVFFYGGPILIIKTALFWFFIYFFLLRFSLSASSGHIAGVPTRPQHWRGLCLQSEPSVYLAHVLCLLCAHRPVCAHQCGGGRADEAPGRLQQGGPGGGGDGCRNWAGAGPGHPLLHGHPHVWGRRGGQRTASCWNGPSRSGREKGQTGGQRRQGRWREEGATRRAPGNVQLLWFQPDALLTSTSEYF